ncbi:hypothetical protein GLW08_03480 [Pontibacillus yanchengensis]|uniref:Uncharacterized protein n=2 Tax=Pontibacillus yanchengensis TaxID=462910 RepID=A0ACC7VDW1_9BACI|nr:hypothetical protein [Pontibacillus yanchengensis]MYL35367.1 hypothetical protein [Pontibacillus yanchengensis]MYL52396.1 hypothetical protein [Pontibacillus yanchengensis]
MNKTVLILSLTGILLTSGCSGDKDITIDDSSQSTLEEVDENSSNKTSAEDDKEQPSNQNSDGTEEKISTEEETSTNDNSSKEQQSTGKTSSNKQDNDQESKKEKDAQNSGSEEDKQSSNTSISKQQAVNLVIEHLSMKNKQDVTIEVDHEVTDKYVVHVYEKIEQENNIHTATIGWYYVNKYSGKVTNMMS